MSPPLYVIAIPSTHTRTENILLRRKKYQSRDHTNKKDKKEKNAEKKNVESLAIKGANKKFAKRNPSHVLRY